MDFKELEQKRLKLEERLRQHEEAIQQLRAKLQILEDAKAIVSEDDDHFMKGPTSLAGQRSVPKKGSGRKTQKKIGARNGSSEIVRAIVKSFTGAFSLRDVMAAAKRSEDAVTRSLDERSTTSTLYNWWQQGRLVQVVERRGNKPSLYRVNGNALDAMERRKSKRSMEFPLTDMIRDVAKHMGPKFTKGQLFEALLKHYPQYAARFKLDSVGAKLNTLASQNKGARFVERNTQGNIYGPA